MSLYAKRKEVIMKKILSRRLLLFITLLSSIFFFAVLFQLQVVPMKYLIALLIILSVIILMLYRGEKDKENEHSTRVVFLKLINIILAVVLIFASWNLMKGSDFLAKIAGNDEQTIDVNVVVLASSSYQELSDLVEVPFGANTSSDAINVNKTETLIEDEIGDIEVTGYTTDDELVKALENKDIEAMIIKSVDMEAINDIEEGFEDKIRIIKTFELKIPSVEANRAKVTKEPFHVLVLGTDKTGKISRGDALSDVNMVATINPIKKQILITSIPRDYYVDLYSEGTNYGKDKLTHSAKKGTQCTVATIENILGIDINYYAKFNFTSFMNVVDALGGIEVDIPKYAVFGNDEGVFTTKKGNHGNGYTLKPGVTEMDGDKALAFVRERKSFKSGDNVRNANQMIMLKAIVKKCCSPAIITKIDGVLNSLSESFTTNMPESDIKSLLNMQIDDMSPWDVQTFHLEGDPTKRTFEFATVSEAAVRKANARGLSVTEPIQESVEQAKEYIQVVMDGKEFLKIKAE